MSQGRAPSMESHYAEGPSQSPPSRRDLGQPAAGEEPEQPRWRRSSAHQAASTSVRSAISTTAERSHRGHHKFFALKGEAEYRAFDTIDNAPEERGGITIAIAHVEYETDAPLRPSTARAPTHQEHDHRRRPDGRPSSSSPRPTARCPRHRAHPRPPGRGAVSSSSSTRSTRSTTRAIDLVGLESIGSSSTTSRATTSVVELGAEGPRGARRGQPAYGPIQELWTRSTPYPTRSGRSTAVPHAGRGRLRHQGRGPSRPGGSARHREGRRRGQLIGQDDPQGRRHRRRDVQAPRRGRAGDNVGCLLRASSATRSSGAGPGQATHQAPHEVHRAGLRLTGGGPPPPSTTATGPSSTSARPT